MFWPPDSLRVPLFSGIFFVIAGVICYAILRRWSWGGALLWLAVTLVVWIPLPIGPDQSQKEKLFYAFLPPQTLEMRVLPENPANRNVALTGFYTEAEGFLGFDSLQIKGWERKGDELILVDPEDNLLAWHGRTGGTATLMFRPGSGPAEARVNWNGATTRYDLTATDPADDQIKQQFSVPIYADWHALLLVLHMTITLLTLILYTEIIPSLSLASPKHRWLAHALPFYLVWSVYLIVFWPGFVPHDSIDQWTQMVTGRLINWHPVAHTLTIWLITRLWYSPAAVALVQIAVTGSVFGWTIDTLRNHGAPAWLAWATTLVLAALPVTGIFSINLWKDVLFSTAMVALTTLFFKIVATKGTWLDEKTAWLSLAAALIFVSLYRKNGFFVASISLVVIAWAFRAHWRTFLKSALLFVAAYSLFSTPVLRLFNIPSTNNARYQLVMADLLATYMGDGTNFSPADRAVLEPAFPSYPWPPDCNRNYGLIYSRYPDSSLMLDRSYLVAHTREIVDITLRTIRQNPWPTLEHFACRGAFVFRIREENANVEVGQFTIYPNDFGIRASSLLPSLYSPGIQFLHQLSHNKQINWLIWRMPLWMYLSIFGCALFCIRNRTWRPLLVLVPGLLVVLPLIVLSMGQIFRYVYSMFLIGVLFSGYFWLCSLPVPPATATSETPAEN